MSGLIPFRDAWRRMSVGWAARLSIDPFDDDEADFFRSILAGRQGGAQRLRVCLHPQDWRVRDDAAVQAFTARVQSAVSGVGALEVAVCRAGAGEMASSLPNFRWSTGSTVPVGVAEGPTTLIVSDVRSGRSWVRASEAAPDPPYHWLELAWSQASTPQIRRFAGPSVTVGRASSGFTCDLAISPPPLADGVNMGGLSARTLHIAPHFDGSRIQLTNLGRNPIELETPARPQLATGAGACVADRLTLRWPRGRGGHGFRLEVAPSHYVRLAWSSSGGSGVVSWLAAPALATLDLGGGRALRADLSTLGDGWCAVWVSDPAGAAEGFGQLVRNDSEPLRVADVRAAVTWL